MNSFPSEHFFSLLASNFLVLSESAREKTQSTERAFKHARSFYTHFLLRRKKLKRRGMKTLWLLQWKFSRLCVFALSFRSFFMWKHKYLCVEGENELSLTHTIWLRRPKENEKTFLDMKFILEYMLIFSSHFNANFSGWIINQCGTNFEAFWFLIVTIP